MNGEKIDDKQKLKQNRAQPTQSIKYELAATTENTKPKKKPLTGDYRKKKTVPFNKRNQLFNKFKPMMTTIVIALIIGLILGFIMLNIFGTFENGMTTSGDNPVVNLDTTSKDTAVEKTNNTELPTIQAYILQGGVFSNVENAEELAEDYQTNDISTMIWERHGQYFLIVGLANTLDNANKLASDIDKKRLEVFVKEWETPVIEIQLTNDEGEWIQTFQQLLMDSIENLDVQENGSFDQWVQWLEDAPDQSDSLISFKKSIQPIIENAEENSDSFSQDELLKVWFQYEMIFGN